jgi:hypothetical protein|tara:strand:- start:69 stop:902 length:834 start_codon:yes stop_codon:yes gene_type:complete
MATTANNTKKTGSRTSKSAPISSPISTLSTSAAPIKRVENTKKDKIYTILKGGGIWFKLRQQNITVFDESTGKVRQLRYSPNENSVFADEQSENTIREQIIFNNKTLPVSHTNPPLQRYLDLHPDNVSNGGKVFSLIDTEKKAEMQLDKEFAILDAVGMVRDQSIEQLLPVAMFLGIDTSQKNMEIKRELLMQAKANPKGFIEMFDNPIVRIKSTLISAVDFQILKSDADGMKWFDSKKLIVSTPAGQNTVDIATRYCLSEKGALVLEEIERQLSKI